MIEQARQALGDILAGVVLVGLAAVGLASLAANPDLTVYDFGTDPGPGLFPRLLLWALAVGGAALAGRAAWTLAWHWPRRRAPWVTEPRRFALPAFFVLSLAAYIVALRPLDFRAATMPFAAVWILVLARQLGGRWSARAVALAAGGGVLITVVVYYVFKGFVKVPLP